MRKELYQRLNDKLKNNDMISRNGRVSEQADKSSISSVSLEEQQLLRMQELRELEGQYLLNQQNIALEESIFSENPSIIQTIVSDNNKLALVLLFGVSIFALYITLKNNNQK